MVLDHITTVTGTVAPNELGPTLTHEHLYCDISAHSGKTDNILTDVSLISTELAHYRKAGGNTIIEVTPIGIGRNPLCLRDISLKSGVTIICGIAFYDEKTYPDWVNHTSVDRIADFFVREIQDGTQGVKAGLIGELASRNQPASNCHDYKLSENEARVFRAAAQAQKRTDVAITTHASLGRPGLAQLRVLEKAGADLEKVAIGHCDAQCHDDLAKDLEYYLAILKTGAFCEFDLIGWEELIPDEARAQRIASLIQLGYERKLLLSTDTCRRSQLYHYGGRGFDFLWYSFLPRLRKLGVTEAQINSMLVQAPRKLLM